MTRPCRQDAGFTLLDVLVAIALLSLVTVLLQPGLRLTARTASLSQFQNELAIQDDALAAVERLLASAVPLVPDGDDAAFLGTPTEVRFIAPRLGGDPGAGMARFGIAVERAPESGDDQRRLIARAGPLARSAAITARQTEDVLLNGLKSGGFRYFGAHEPREDPRWDAAWTRADAFPDLVDIRIVSADGTRVGHRSVELKLRPKS